MLYCSPTDGWIIMSKLVRLLVNSLCVFSIERCCRFYDSGLNVEKSETMLHKSCIMMMSSGDILMVSKLPVWVLSSRDLGARCPTFSGPVSSRSHVPVCHAQQLRPVHMCGRYWHVSVCTCLSAKWNEQKRSFIEILTWYRAPLSLGDSSQQDRLLIAKMNLHKTKHIFATCLSVSDWCVNTFIDL